eukprot:TRINITY_DN29378_c0_g1_i1.p1 TRINITY_DN29378_c0_g1~~TRINITY_DN29378_c0_g1_i1.p1  ORF type:complete len:235 (+),score=19.91 TRINITY_DN29378_c0_g1_i1:74-778(+)
MSYFLVLGLACYMISGLVVAFEPCGVLTQGACNLLSCDASRGPTRCTTEVGRLGLFCNCIDGYCSVDGTCLRDPRLPPGCGTRTGGSCTFLKCHQSRNSVCHKGECVCIRDQCSRDGKCVEELFPCNRDIGVTCNVFSGCDASTGATCMGGLCLCSEGSCAENGKCIAAVAEETLATSQFAEKDEHKEIVSHSARALSLAMLALVAFAVVVALRSRTQSKATFLRSASKKLLSS